MSARITRRPPGVRSRFISRTRRRTTAAACCMSRARRISLAPSRPRSIAGSSRSRATTIRSRPSRRALAISPRSPACSRSSISWDERDGLHVADDRIVQADLSPPTAATVTDDRRGRLTTSSSNYTCPATNRTSAPLLTCVDRLDLSLADRSLRCRHRASWWVVRAHTGAVAYANTSYNGTRSPPRLPEVAAGTYYVRS